ncbi:SMC-Scp complex subunit ScpB [Pseudoxanthomonas winnipegensis]|jgi:segregation and condensation protein B|uniref:SMC-Scp complex subunit ScpB n=1 Tax=Pseudoxanthomonas winnipegensis TaxID=2480810 RepID=A0A4Q8L793_9GAMM|nr:SMC-Scp complex subunit ScpB [Pseudoxanthomonas winnipegensis]TMN18160.1 SMC-Scp complex subunit ScpB [Pseudoxanthomonas sp. X-1]UAY76340.1 SMC-Scp complex subunit ScpB [Pseudoxanthomonas sp. X-1]
MHEDDAFDTETAAAPVAQADQGLINRIVEAALLASAQPMSLAQLAELFPEDRPAPEGSLDLALEQLARACAERGVELVEVASGWRYQVKQDVHAWVSRMWTERKTRYTRATLETLALIAYRQPITRGEIEQVRGVAVSSNIIQALEEREWIRVVGHRDVPGRPALFGTTRAFLDYFGLKRLDELPPLSELKDIAELDPQLPLPGAPLPARAAAEGQPDADADAEAAPADDAATGDDDGEQPASHDSTPAQDAPETDDGTSPPATQDAPDLDAPPVDAADPTDAPQTDASASTTHQEDDADAVSSEHKHE